RTPTRPRPAAARRLAGPPPARAGRPCRSRRDRGGADAVPLRLTSSATTRQSRGAAHMSKPLPKAAPAISAKIMAELDAVRLDDRVKGVPGGVSDLRLGDVGRQGWNLLREDLPLPAAVLKTGALDNNSRWMAQFLRATGAVIAPHGKTTMSPQLFQRQLADGAWAITVATIGQLQ